MTVETQTREATYEQQVESFAEKILLASAGTIELYSMFLGERLSLYKHLAAHESLSAAELARLAGCNERYIREWLEQQHVIGVLDVSQADGGEFRFSISTAAAEVLTERDSMNYLAPMVRMMVGIVSPVNQVVEAYRTGDGVPYENYGMDMIEGQAEMNRNAFLYELGQVYIPAMPDVHAKLQQPGARIADIGCGGGWSSIGMARCYPNATIHAYDLDKASIDIAKKNAEEAGLQDRIQFELADISKVQVDDHYDLAIALECLHDMSDPIGALKVMRRFVGSDGTVVIADMKTSKQFPPDDNEDVEHFMYGWSILHCLPVCKAEHPSAETGTVIRPDIMRRYASEAGFRSVEILPVETFFWNIYRMNP